MIIGICSAVIDYVKRMYNEFQEVIDIDDNDDIGEMTFLLSIFL